MKCKYGMAWASVSVAAAALLSACGGGGDGGGGFAPIAVAPATATAEPSGPAPDTAPACLTLPEDGKEIAVTVARNIGVPMSLGAATLTNEGPKAFEGQSYPTLKVHSRLDQLIGRESRHVLHMLPDAPILPAGATTYATDVNAPSSRYAYTYAKLTLAQLNAAIKDGRATFSWGPAFNWEGLDMQAILDQFAMAERRGELAFPSLQPVTPNQSDFTLGKPVTLLMLERQALGTASLSSLYERKVREITLTNVGREDVTVGDVKHPQACRFDIVVRTADAYLRSLDQGQIATRAATAWFGRGGLVKIELKGSGA